MNLPQPCAYVGDVVHKRLRPVEHALRYRVFSLFLDVDRLNETAGKLRFFSYNRFNLFSVHDRDFGTSDGRALGDYVRDTLSKAGMPHDNARIFMLCYPRMLGYAFNPLTTYYTIRNERLSAVIYEVSNTFGDRRSYVIPVQEGASDAVHAQACAKQLYVSPFNEVEGHYGFRINLPADDVILGVNLRTADGPLMKAYFQGSKRSLTDRFLVRALIAFPFQSLKVIGGIHYEALKLWLKGLRISPRPKAPKHPVSVPQSQEKTA
ncbi:MAG: DUF1365 domain-containing protein [Hyphomicrobiales bacterium]